jgi:porin
MKRQEIFAERSISSVALSTRLLEIQQKPTIDLAEAEVCTLSLPETGVDVACRIIDWAKLDPAAPSGRTARLRKIAMAALSWLALSCNASHAEKPASGSPLHDPLEHPLFSDYSIAPIDPRLLDFKQGLIDLGYNFQVNYTGEIAGNPRGGGQRSAIYEGLLELGLDGDLHRIMGWAGGSFHINAFQIHGHGLTNFNVFNFSTISGIEARPTTRLFEAWFEQELFGGFASVRIGQLAADSEFLNSDFDALYWNGTFGWPNFASSNLPGTGPGYPFATPGIRLKLMPDPNITLLFALFNGDPSGSRFDVALSQIDNCCGINFRLRDPPLLMGQAEFDYILPFPQTDLAGKLRLGSWYHFGTFNDNFIASDGLPLVEPHGDIGPFRHVGDVAVWAILDQMIWNLDAVDQWTGIGVFVQAMAAPQNRNLVSLEIQAGINFMGIVPGRPADIFGAAFSYTRVSPFVSAAQRLEANFSEDRILVQNYEVMFEATYQAEIVQGFVLQPVFQYVFNPGAGALDPLSAIPRRIPDAAVFGLRSVVKF